MGKDDPCKIIHAFKVGFALCCVSPFYLTDPLFKGVAGDAAIWAAITVVVVLEFSGDAAIWAVITVVVVLEFSAGTIKSIAAIVEDLICNE